MQDAGCLPAIAFMILVINAYLKDIIGAVVWPESGLAKRKMAKDKLKLKRRQQRKSKQSVTDILITRNSFLQHFSILEKIETAGAFHLLLSACVCS